MKYTIITPTYNSEKTLKSTIESVLNQSYFNYEYIIIDGESKDNTLNIIQEYAYKFKEKRVAFKYISEKDTGIYDAMNKGIDLSSGKFLIFLGSDDLLYDNQVLKKLESEVDENKVLYGKVLKEKEGISILDEGMNKVTKYTLFRRPICHQALVTPKVLFKEVGKYDLTYKIKADHKWQIESIIKFGVKYKKTKILISRFSLDGISSRLIKETEKEAIKMFNNYYFSGIVFLKKIIWKIKRSN